MFFFPAAAHVEKDGTFTQTQRMLQWHHKAVEPPGDAQSELEFFYLLGQKIRAKLADSTDPRDRPILDLTWDYPVDEHGEISAEAVLKEINGFHLSGEKQGQLLNTFNEMKPDGSTAGGCWIYTGVYAGGVNQSARRKPGREQSWVAPEWGWAWPMNRRILYNRAAADPDGKPWSERKAYVWWDEEQQKWTGHDVPDFELTKPPSYVPPEGAVGPAALRGDDPFIMQADGLGWLYAPTGLLDGPLPSHYEPSESPVSNALYSQQASPTRQVFSRTDNYSNPSGDEPGAEVFPYVFTTYRLTEHHTAGGMSRWQPYLSELQPEFFCEVSPELARERGLVNNGWATIVTARTAVEARVLVTDRVVPLRGRRQDDPPGRDCPITGASAATPWSPATRPTTCSGSPSTRTCTSRSPRWPRATSSRAAARVVPPCWSTSRPIAGGPASRWTRAMSSATPPAGPMVARARTGSGKERHDGPSSSALGRGVLVRLDRPAWDRPATPAGTSRRPGSASSPTPRSASAARPARWPARSGTASPTTAYNMLGSSYDNTGQLSGSTWRHVAFIEQPKPSATAGRPRHARLRVAERVARCG